MLPSHANIIRYEEYPGGGGDSGLIKDSIPLSWDVANPLSWNVLHPEGGGDSGLIKDSIPLSWDVAKPLSWYEDSPEGGGDSGLINDSIPLSWDVKNMLSWDPNHQRGKQLKQQRNADAEANGIDVEATKKRILEERARGRAGQPHRLGGARAEKVAQGEAVEGGGGERSGCACGVGEDQGE